ncbi:hypothetical protein AWJ20_77 [Sugiyamaella lignohabitans]|uniref:Major facilitator superfamily (MFS) profile domain-containing protein n=1 Tax=Sugiyamaella lignohabitans TaxID=796027 RepID=A0A167CLH3_9ASCO|nr:uncharacterized protein AWJ20_77 [Sugiyamaella lignohabitans]ANB11853.1 hypothetical protein AWJ20_77 [Sugiyamaella lignohabitans]
MVDDGMKQDEVLEVIADADSTFSDDLFGIVIKDDVLYKKQVLVQKALDDIGMTPFHWKLFFLNSFGYASDSLLVVCQSIAQPQVNLEFGRENDRIPGVSTASAVGLLVGAIFWGVGADIIGRRLAFNSSLFLAAVFVIIAGAMPSYISFTAMVALYSAATGGNYCLDASNLLEFLPRKKAFLTTILAVAWGFGYTITGLLAWAFMSNYSCLSADNCPRSSNQGWRYLHYTSGGLVLIAAILRVTIIHMPHTPKFLITQNRDEEAVKFLTDIARKYNRTTTITVEQLSSYGAIQDVKEGNKVRRFTKHVRGIFVSRKSTYSYILLLMLWLLIGLGDPLYSYFRPYYLKTRGYQDNTTASNYIVWRNYAISNICGLVGPLLAWPLLDFKYLRRKGTLAVSALATMLFLFGYTQVRTPTQNTALSFCINAVETMFFAALYGVTPELLPTGSRATGYGIAVALNRVCNIFASIIAGYANVETTAPLFISASMFGALAVVSLLLPFEPAGKYIA